MILCRLLQHRFATCPVFAAPQCSGWTGRMSGSTSGGTIAGACGTAGPRGSTGDSRRTSTCSETQQTIKKKPRPGDKLQKG